MVTKREAVCLLPKRAVCEAELAAGQYLVRKRQRLPRGKRREPLLSSELVGVAGFEPATPSSRTRCATRLRHTPPPVRGGVIAASTGPQARSGTESARCGGAEGACGAGCTPIRCRYVPPRFARPVSGRPRTLLGRSQAVRQRVLIPPCGGSNPPAPARFRSHLRSSAACMRTPPNLSVRRRFKHPGVAGSYNSQRWWPEGSSTVMTAL